MWQWAAEARARRERSRFLAAGRPPVAVHGVYVARRRWDRRRLAHRGHMHVLFNQSECARPRPASVSGRVAHFLERAERNRVYRLKLGRHRVTVAIVETCVAHRMKNPRTAYDDAPPAKLNGWGRRLGKLSSRTWCRARGRGTAADIAALRSKINPYIRGTPRKEVKEPTLRSLPSTTAPVLRLTRDNKKKEREREREGAGVCRGVQKAGERRRRYRRRGGYYSDGPAAKRAPCVLSRRSIRCGGGGGMI
jgi:hypothetical protein